MTLQHFINKIETEENASVVVHCGMRTIRKIPILNTEKNTVINSGISRFYFECRIFHWIRPEVTLNVSGKLKYIAFAIDTYGIPFPVGFKEVKKSNINSSRRLSSTKRNEKCQNP